MYLRDLGETEVGGFGISHPQDLLLIEDVQLVLQACSWAHVAFEDEAVADFFDQQVDQGLRPEQFARIWIHTHPGNSAQPSPTDEETFLRVFGKAEWAVMFILAKENQSYARLRYHVGPGIEVELPVSVDYGHSFRGCDFTAWEQEYAENVFSEESLLSESDLELGLQSSFHNQVPAPWYDYWLEGEIFEGINE